MPPATNRIVQKPHTNAFFFACSCYNSVGLESPFNGEANWLLLTPTNYGVNLQWFSPVMTNGDVIAGYHLYFGGSSRTYTNMIDVGLTTNYALTLITNPPPLKGFYVTISVTNGFLNYRPRLDTGKWVGTTFALTNITNGQTLFYRGSNSPSGTNLPVKFSGRQWFT